MPQGGGLRTQPRPVRRRKAEDWAGTPRRQVGFASGGSAVSVLGRTRLVLTSDRPPPVTRLRAPIGGDTTRGHGRRKASIRRGRDGDPLRALPACRPPRRPPRSRHRRRPRTSLRAAPLRLRARRAGSTEPTLRDPLFSLLRRRRHGSHGRARAHRAPSAFVRAAAQARSIWWGRAPGHTLEPSQAHGRRLRLADRLLEQGRCGNTLKPLNGMRGAANRCAATVFPGDSVEHANGMRGGRFAGDGVVPARDLRKL